MKQAHTIVQINIWISNITMFIEFVIITIVQCENIQPPQFPNVTLTLTGLDIGARATYICDSGLKVNGTMRLTCTASGWSDDIPTNCYGTDYT